MAASASNTTTVQYLIWISCEEYIAIWWTECWHTRFIIHPKNRHTYNFFLMRMKTISPAKIKGRSLLPLDYLPILQRQDENPQSLLWLENHYVWWMLQSLGASILDDFCPVFRYDSKHLQSFIYWFYDFLSLIYLAALFREYRVIRPCWMRKQLIQSLSYILLASSVLLSGTIDDCDCEIFILILIQDSLALMSHARLLLSHVSKVISGHNSDTVSCPLIK